MESETCLFGWHKERVTISRWKLQDISYFGSLCRDKQFQKMIKLATQRTHKITSNANSHNKKKTTSKERTRNANNKKLLKKNQIGRKIKETRKHN